ncbi:MAG TPA: hypothetical protein VG387_15570 [Rhizomicrobium sp.]|nr:hypothetical protein [Rhizomicrobium sp.]
MAKQPLFKNRQWAVTDYGLEAIVGARTPEDGDEQGSTPDYEIPASRLLETTARDGVELYDWPVHMAEKTWIFLGAFIEAFLFALIAHQQSEKIQADILAKSIKYARKSSNA